VVDGKDLLDEPEQAYGDRARHFQQIHPSTSPATTIPKMKGLKCWVRYMDAVEGHSEDEEDNVSLDQ
jgi:hypothetical protein